MSKIFDALNKAEGEAASLALPLIDAAGKASPTEDQRAHIDVAQSFIQPARAQTGAQAATGAGSAGQTFRTNGIPHGSDQVQPLTDSGSCECVFESVGQQEN